MPRASISSTLFFELRLEARRAVAEVECLEIVDVLALAAADGVEVVFHLGRELVVDQAGRWSSRSLTTENATQVGTSAPPFLKT